jgi:energy-coupling factor transporter transmembrane protein EcfT
MSISVLKANFPSLILFFLVLLALMSATRISLLKTLSSLRYFILLLGFVFIVRSVSMPGESVFSFFNISVSKQGLQDGGLIAVRFFVVMVTGMLFSATTNSSSIKNAFQWFLKPVPFIPEKRAAVMISLALRFLPLILVQAKQISDAQKARCSDLEKNPAKRIIRLVVPLLKKTFESADYLVLAMEARCYNEDRTDPEFKPSGREGQFFAAGAVLSAILILF